MSSTVAVPGATMGLILMTFSLLLPGSTQGNVGHVCVVQPPRDIG